MKAPTTTTNRTDIPQLTEPLSVGQLAIIESARAGGRLDIDLLHVMDRRDNLLVEQELMHGAGSSAFVYSFPVSGKTIAGVSVIGAQHLANAYGKLRHRLIASVQKIGSLFTFTSYPTADSSMRVEAHIIADLAAEPDYYQCVIEVQDLNTGNSVQMTRRELRYERRQDGSLFERPHYDTIAESKAYRNAILRLLPQDFVMKWKLQMLQLRKEDLITEDVLTAKRAAVIRFAAAKGIPLDRHAVERLTVEQMGGLAEAAHAENEAAFGHALAALGLRIIDVEDQKVTTTSPPATTQKTARQGGRRNDPPLQGEKDARTEPPASPPAAASPPPPPASPPPPPPPPPAAAPATTPARQTGQQDAIDFDA